MKEMIGHIGYISYQIKENTFGLEMWLACWQSAQVLIVPFLQCLQVSQRTTIVPMIALKYEI